jgi:hypothetical protein
MKMKMPYLKTFFVLAAFSVAAACSPSVGSKEWCKDMKQKAKAQWTAQEAADFTKHCILPK